MSTVTAKYQDPDATSFVLDEGEGRLFAWGNLEGFEQVDTQESEGYKDHAPMTTICRRLSDGALFSYDWQKYTSYYGSGEHSYWDSDSIFRVDRKEEQVTYTRVWYDRVKAKSEASLT